MQTLMDFFFVLTVDGKYFKENKAIFHVLFVSHMKSLVFNSSPGFILQQDVLIISVLVFAVIFSEGNVSQINKLSQSYSLNKLHPLCRESIR